MGLRFESVRVRVCDGTLDNGHAPDLAGALAAARPELHAAGLVSSVVCGAREADPLRFTSTRALYADMRRHGLSDLSHRCTVRKLHLFGESAALPVLVVRSHRWAYWEWVSLVSEVLTIAPSWGRPDPASPGIPIAPTRRAFARALEDAIRRHAQAPPDGTDLFIPLQSAPPVRLQQRWWRSPQGEVGRLAAHGLLAQGAPPWA